MYICNVLIYVPLQSLQIVTSFVGFIGVVDFLGENSVLPGPLKQKIR